MNYLDGTDHWPKFQWDHAEIESVVADVRYRQGRLLGRMETLNPCYRAEANLLTLTANAVKTSAMDGEHFDPEQVRSSIAQKLGLDHAPAPAETEHDFAGIVDVTFDASQRYSALLTAERLFGWHSFLFPGGGDARKQRAAGEPDGARGEGGPEVFSPERALQEIRAFLDWFNCLSTVDPVLKAGLAHFWFVTMRPFQGGNGKIARAIADLALARVDQSPERFYSLSVQLESEKKAYDDALQTSQRRGGDVTVWLEWYLGCLGRAIDSAEASLATILRKARLSERINLGAINERQRKVLNRLMEDFQLRLNHFKYTGIARCSKETARREIQDLLKRGFIAQCSVDGPRAIYRLGDVGR